MADDAMPSATVHKWLTEGVIVAAVPAWVYLTAWGYDYGYSAHFGIPLEFVSVDIGSVMILGGMSLLWLGFAGLAGNSIANGVLWLCDKSAPRWNRVHGVPSMLVWIVILGWFFAVSRPLAGLTAFVVLLVVFYYLNRLLQDERTMSQHASNSPSWLTPMWIFTFPFPPTIRLLSACGVFSVGFMFVLGGAIARTQKDFVVLEGNPPLVLLRAHGDRAICTTVANGRTQRLFRFVQIGDSAGAWTVKRIGPLSPERE